MRSRKQWREKVLGTESYQQRSAARSTLTHWYVGPLQLCGCSLWEAVLERYWRRCPRPLSCLQFLKSPGAWYIQRECCLTWRRWGWSPWAETNNVISHSGSSMALTFHNSRAWGLIPLNYPVCMDFFKSLTSGSSSYTAVTGKTIHSPSIKHLSRRVVGMVVALIVVISKMCFGLVNETMFGSDTRAKWCIRVGKLLLQVGLTQCWTVTDQSQRSGHAHFD